MFDQDSLAEIVITSQDAFRFACKMSGPIEIQAVHRETNAEHTFSVNQPFATFGRAAAAGVRLSDPSVSQAHAFLQVVEGVPYCVDLGSRAGVIWDDGTQGRGWVTRGQTLRMGAYDIRVLSPVADAPPFSPRHPEVEGGRELDLSPVAFEVHSKGTRVDVFPLERPVTLVGRHPNCQLRFVDESVGYFHGCVVNTPDGVWWLDVIGRQGCRVNSRQVRLARLRDGDLVELGKVALVLRVGEPAESLITGRACGVMVRPPAFAGGVHSPNASDASLAPVREVMDQFQQCLTNMVGMFTAVQQEHIALICEQMREVQELRRQLRELRGEPAATTGAAAAGPAIAAGQSAPPPKPHTPNPQVSGGAEKAALADAHSWFLTRLASLGQSPPPTAAPG